MKTMRFDLESTFTAIAVLTLFCLEVSVSSPCKQLQSKFGSVCVCSADYCDYLENPKPAAEKEVIIISSGKNDDFFMRTNGAFSSASAKNIENTAAFDTAFIIIDTENPGFYRMPFRESNKSRIQSSLTIHVDRDKIYQKIVGFGGAHTGSVAHLLNRMPSQLQDHLYKSYYHKDGIGFNMLRTSIGGCDFDLAPWAYNEYPEDDSKLTNFSKLDARDELKVQQVQRLKEVSDVSELKIMAAAWSPPRWMKSNRNWTGFSYLLPQFYQTWANYHLRFLELMDAKNTPIWSISTGNEPLNGVIGWFFVHFMSLGWTPSNQALWLSEHLGPTIRRSKFKDVLIFGNDDQRYTYPAWFLKMNRTGSSALSYLDGLAVHWYWDDVFAPNLMDEAHRLMPEKLILNTESCIGDKPWQTHGPELGSWERGEQYMRTMLKNFKHAYNGWIDWNLVLNEDGGPNYVQNHVDAPIIVNSQNYSEFYKQPIFYAIGHFSKFVPEGSERIDAKVFSSNINIDAVAFRRPDKLIVLVLYNSGDLPVNITLNDSLQGRFQINVPKRSWHTILYK